MFGEIENKYHININTSNPQDHVPESEHNNCTIEERVQVKYHRLPYHHLPRVMVHFIVPECTKKIIFFPNKNGISEYYSPQMILHQQNLEFSKHCSHEFGSYCQAHNDNPRLKNTNAACTYNAIYL